MPRGFLVKRRSRRPAGAYRVRAAGGPAVPRLEEAPRVPQPSPEPLESPPPPRSPLAAVWGAGPAESVAPVEPERWAASFPLEEKLPPPPPPPAPLPRPAPPPLPRAPAKKPKAARRLSFADEVTTSPVLGLRIKAAAAAAGGAGVPGLCPARLRGEFVCQLCQEPYADPLALAQHRCSRIVRVEYRCPECHKSFSCPANLASHRRWHKPRPPAAPAGPGKENSAARPPDSARPPSPGPARAPSAASGELFGCPFCQKRFRRQAYLRKHLGTHQPPPAPPPPFAGPLCAAPFPPAEPPPDKHPLWQAVREELLLPLAGPEPEKRLFPCPHCPAAFFSSPGLARHASKCHPAESRPVLLLQLPLRPGC